MALQQSRGLLRGAVLVVDLDDNLPNSGPVLVANSSQDCQLRQLGVDLEQVDALDRELVDLLGQCAELDLVLACAQRKVADRLPVLLVASASSGLLEVAQRI